MDRKLIDYLPQILKDVEDIKELMTSEQILIIDLWNAIDNILNEAFVDYQTDYGISRWESILNINPLDTDILEDRRYRIKSKLNESLPYSKRKLIFMLNSLCGEIKYILDINTKDLVLKLRLETTSKGLLKEIRDLIDRVTPLNMILDICLLINIYIILINKNYINVNKMVNRATLQLQNYVNYKNIINRFIITNKKFRCFDDEWCFGDDNVFFNDYIDIFKFTNSMSFNDIKLINKNLINLDRIVNHNVFQLQNYIKSKEIINKIVVYTNEHYFNILKILINANIKSPITLNKIINYNAFQLQNYIRFKGITNKIIVYTNEHYINILKLLVNIHYKSSRIFIDNRIHINQIEIKNSISIKPTIKFEINTKEDFNNCIRTIEHATKYFSNDWCFGDDDAYFDNYVEREVI